MKIKTMVADLMHADEFDNKVNALLADGWLLKKREHKETSIYYGDRDSKKKIASPEVLYAELEKPDEAAPDPVELVRQLQAFCDCVDLETCQCGGCPLEWLCGQIGAGRQLDEWELPEEG